MSIERALAEASAASVASNLSPMSVANSSAAEVGLTPVGERTNNGRPMTTSKPEIC